MASEKRITTAPIGEYYDDLLTIDSWINNRTRGLQAAKLLSDQLKLRENEIKTTMEYLAQKRGISVNELWSQVLSGTVEKLEDD